MKKELLIIDPQIDFLEGGNLAVPGATEDMNRVVDMIKRNINRIDNIHVTMDMHRQIDIGHPMFWLDNKGDNIDPFTVLSLDDLTQGKIRPFLPSLSGRVKEYFEKLIDNKRYMPIVWPYHCLIGSVGATIYKPLFDILCQWEHDNLKQVDYVLKGTNPYTEHYSAIQADVPDSNDPTTSLNIDLLESLQNTDMILLAGEALSHCLANTCKDIADNFGEENIKKIVLLTDGTSNVPGFENLGEEFIKELSARGMKTSTTKDI